MSDEMVLSKEYRLMVELCEEMGIKLVPGAKAPMLRGKELTVDEIVDMSLTEEEIEYMIKTYSKESIT